MDKEQLKTYFIIFGVILIAVFLLFKLRDYVDGDVTGKTVEQDLDTSNIKQAEEIPSACTASQNCGSPTCGVASGRGSGCGCGG